MSVLPAQPNQHNTTPIKRFYWLDTMRGVAALSVVLWHWQHFFFDSSTSDTTGQLVRTGFPLYKLFRPLYEQGWRAVELFFTLSGFVFFWLYSEKIAKKEISFRKYLKFRLSRLYPLHLLTLLVVTVGQIWYYCLNSYFFVYKDNTTTNFISNLTLTNSWFSSNFSFNGPAWSVSVEMLLYLIFFSICYMRLNHWWYAVGLIFIGWLLKDSSLSSVATGIMSFFVGGIAYYIYSFVHQKFQPSYRLLFLLLVPLIIVLAFLYRYIFKYELPTYFYELLLFPLIICAVALAESVLPPRFGKRFSFIGDISYASYLWHFPLQLALMLAISLLGWSRNVFYSPWSLLLFYCLLIPLSALSYRYFEIPLQAFLREKKAQKVRIKQTA